MALPHPTTNQPPAVAIIADAHLHDTARGYDCPGLLVGDKWLNLRSWRDTRRSSRLFNESHAALTAALDEVQRRKIRHVVLLGDYTDDGQRQATDRLAQMLLDRQRRYGTSFYAIPGNHDVFGPVGKHNSTRFVTGPDRSVLVTSAPKIAATEPGRAVLTSRMYCDGMPAGLLPIAEFGLFRQPGYLHWETPFGLSDRIEHRLYDATSAKGSVTHRLMDASYLVEPAPDLWLLMIDANVFEPRDDQPDPARKHAFIDSSDAGWNAVLRVKPFLIGWIADVCARADLLGKNLLICSHYPVVDPFDDQTGSESVLFTRTDVLRRTPAPAVADALIRAGMRHHFSGHVHANSLTRRNSPAGHLTNIAVPAPVAFPPGFVVAHAKGMHPGIETVSIAKLPLDQALLAVYRAEAEADAVAGPQATALDAPDYGAFLYAQLRGRALERLMPQDWPPAIAAAALQANAADLGCLMLGAMRVPAASSPKGDTAHAEAAKAVIPDFPPRPVDAVLLTELHRSAAMHGVTPDALQGCALHDLIADWYCLRQGGAMAAPFIPAASVRLYRFLAAEFGTFSPVCADDTVRFFAIFLAVLGMSLDRMQAAPPQT